MNTLCIVFAASSIFFPLGIACAYFTVALRSTLKELRKDEGAK